MAAKSSHLSITIILLSCLSYPSTSTDFNYPAAFNFGDSNSDTGDLAAGLGIRLGLPYGQTYFNSPSGRFSDGRLVLDFLSNDQLLCHIFNQQIKHILYTWVRIF
ncbi:GDSL esterase/lipase At1g54790 [Linum grandiflorum]